MEIRIYEVKINGKQTFVSETAYLKDKPELIK
jgi:hypothetical protein